MRTEHDRYRCGWRGCLPVSAVVVQIFSTLWFAESKRSSSVRLQRNACCPAQTRHARSAFHASRYPPRCFRCR